MNRKYLYLLVIPMVVVGIIGFLDSKLSKIDDSFTERLKPDEKTKIIVEPKKKKVTKITKDGKKTEDGSRGTVIIIDKDGKTTIINRRRGILFEPGLTMFYSKNKLMYGLDCQWAYWRKWGLISGLGMSHNQDFSVFTAVSYNFYSNTSVGIGLDDEFKTVVNLRVAF